MSLYTGVIKIYLDLYISKNGPKLVSFYQKLQSDSGETSQMF